MFQGFTWLAEQLIVTYFHIFWSVNMFYYLCLCNEYDQPRRPSFILVIYAIVSF